MSRSIITLHPQARDFLFKYFRNVNRVFCDALGLLEIDYVGIALLTPKDELFFFSSRPSIEWNIIEHNLWISDERFTQAFFGQEKPIVLQNQFSEFCISFSVPSIFDNYRVVYTFASKSSDKKDHLTITNNIAMLIRIGQFCLKKIFSILPCHQYNYQQKPYLKLVVNNRESYENIT